MLQSNGKAKSTASDSAAGLPPCSQRRTVALACRILAHEGLADNVLGHVSVRCGPDRVAIRCRGPEERGLLFTTAADVKVVDLDGRGELGEGYALPNEFPIHAELLRARPDLQAVVHAHPPAVLLAGLAGVALRPVFGAYNIPAMRMALDDVPIYPRAVLIRTPELGREMVRAMGAASVCVLRGHGVTTAGESVEQALVRATNLEALARVSVDLHRLGADVADLPADDLTELPDLGSAFNDLSVWRYYVARLEHTGLGEV